MLATPSWSFVSSPNLTPSNGNTLLSVSCLSATDCTGVGYFQHTGTDILIESWNGTAWSIAPSVNPIPGGGDAKLNSISCVSVSNCTAVGYFSISGPEMTLVESWNGTSWSIVPSPNTNAKQPRSK